MDFRVGARTLFRGGAIATAAALLAAMAVAAPPARAQTMQLDPNLPVPTVATSVADDGTATLTLTSPDPNAVCVWGVEWDTGDPLEHGAAAGLRPDGQGPSQGGTVPPVCGTGTLSTSITLSPAQVGPAATSIRVLWTPISNVWTHSAYTTVAWPITPDVPGGAPTLSLAWSPDGTLRASATANAPCHWRFESRLSKGKWTGTWIGGEPGQPCTAAQSATWDAPESLWPSAGEVRAAYIPAGTTAASSSTLSEWTSVPYTYQTYSSLSLAVVDQQVSIDGQPASACRVAVSWLVGGQWTDASPVPATGCGLPGVSPTPPIAFSDAPKGATQLKVAYLSTPAMTSRGAWSAPLPLAGLLPAEDAIAVEQPDGSIDVSFTDPNPSGSVCAWRWELRRQGTKNIYGAGSTKVAPTTTVPCGGAVSIPAALDDPANLDLLLWPDADGANDPTNEAPWVAVSLPDVDLSPKVKTGKGAKPLLSVSWWTSQEISTSVIRAKISAPGAVSGTCSYRLEWTAPGVAARGVWTTGPCSGVWVPLPQLATGWSAQWTIKAAWAKGTVGEKPSKYSSFRNVLYIGALDPVNLRLSANGTSFYWYVQEPPIAACNAQVQLLSTTDPATWEILSDSYAVPLGLCDDLWVQHPLTTTSAKAMRIRLTAGTSATPTGEWIYAALTPLALPTDAVVRWNDAGTPVLTFTDPNPPGTVCFWQVRVAGAQVDDVQIAANGSTTCSTKTTFALDANLDWSKVTSVDLLGTPIPQVTALDAWGLAGILSVPYTPRLAEGSGAAPTATIQVDQYGYTEIHVVGDSCRYVAQWRIPGESLWRTEQWPTSTACSTVVPLPSLGATAAAIEVRAAAAKLTGDVATVGSWSAPVATIDPIPVPQVALFPTSTRVRVQNQPSSLCGTVFEVRRNGIVLTSGLVRATGAPGPLECGPWAANTTMIAIPQWSAQAGDELRFAFTRGNGVDQMIGPWTPWRAWPVEDAADPVVSITAPANGSTIDGSVTTTVTATDDIGIERIEIRSGTRLLGTALLPSSGDTWTIPWDSWALPNGSVTYTATAIDTSGRSTTVEGRVVIANPPGVEKVPAKGATTVMVTGKVSTKGSKPSPVSVEQGSRVQLRMKDKTFTGAKVFVRLGSTWIALGTVDKKGRLPALRVNGPGPYVLRLAPSTGKTGYLALTTS